MSQLTYLEALVVGAFQGVTELFPVSSLGHSVLVPAIIGGAWARDLSVSAPESPYLAFLVGLHVATAAALLTFFRRDWGLILKGFATSIRRRQVDQPYERLAWLIVIATVPVGVGGLLLEHLFRTTLGRPIPAAAFLMANGGVLTIGELLRRRRGNVEAEEGRPAREPAPCVEGAGVSSRTVVARRSSAGHRARRFASGCRARSSSWQTIPPRTHGSRPSGSGRPS